MHKNCISPLPTIHPLTHHNITTLPHHHHTSIGKATRTATKVKSFLQRVQNSQTVSARTARKKQVSTAGVVLETDYFPPLEDVDLEIVLAPVRRLQPKIQARPPPVVQIERCDLLMQIVAARNIPLRIEYDVGGGGSGGVGEKSGKQSTRRCVFTSYPLSVLFPLSALSDRFFSARF
jgi:hypothetical protein